MRALLLEKEREASDLWRLQVRKIPENKKILKNKN
jgi:hypothetical protein